jgi:hypothetical protein
LNFEFAACLYPFLHRVNYACAGRIIYRLQTGVYYSARRVVNNAPRGV